MNCQSLQNRILALPDPRQLPENLREHVDACPACLTWWNRAIHLERLLAHLPAPAPSDKKAVLLDELNAVGPVIKSIPSLQRHASWSLPGARTLAGLAAAVLIAVGGWMMTRPGAKIADAKQSGPSDPFLTKIVQRDLALAQARSADQRLEVLSGLADDVSAEARSLSKIANPEELHDLSGLFQKVVNEGIVEQVRKLPEHAMTRTQKNALLQKLTTQLSEAGLHAEEAARESPPHAQPALKSISDTARESQVKLKAMLGA